MSLIQNPTIGRKLQRSLRLTALPDSILAPEIVGVILVEDQSAPLVEEERGCMGTTELAAVALENPIILLVRVGAPAPYDLTVKAAHFSTTTDQILQLSVPTVAVVGLTVAGDTQFTDMELPGRPASQLGRDTQVGVPTRRTIWQGFCLANTPYRIPLALRIGTIGKGSNLTSLMIAGITVNTTLRGGFEWTESVPQG